MSCIALPKPVEQDFGSADTSWAGIAQSIRAHAAAQPPELARDLCEWADFIAGVAELQNRANRR
jgi:hypothetical protein